MHYELMGTITLVFMLALDFFHCVGHATFGNLFLLMDSSVMLVRRRISSPVVDHALWVVEALGPGGRRTLGGR